MRIAVVTQRYGAHINGGAELHARYIAEHLARHVEVEVLTTCARDYVTWRNELTPGAESVNGVPVHRFPVTHERDPGAFGRQSEKVFTRRHSIMDELAWLDAEGPTSPALVAHVAAHERDFDFFLLFSVRYYHAYHGARAVPGKAILVPTAERDSALGLGIFPPVFRGVRALMYNSFEERALIQGVSANHDVPSVVVGVGSEISEQADPGRFRQKFGQRNRFAIYVGRIDENKGCLELFDFFIRYAALSADGPDLVLIGNPIIPIPTHPRIRHLGVVTDADKFDALAAADLLVMPSYFESLSMVALEAWALGRPVLANGRCDVLRGQTIRSHGGLYYENFEEFVEALRALDNPRLAGTLGQQGRAYFQRHYTWPVIEAKYLEMFERLTAEPSSPSRMDPVPGWLSRRRRVLPPADAVVGAIPAGAALTAVPGSIESVAGRGPAGEHAGVRAGRSGPPTRTGPPAKPDGPARSSAPARSERPARPATVVAPVRREGQPGRPSERRSEGGSRGRDRARRDPRQETRGDTARSANTPRAVPQAPGTSPANGGKAAGAPRRDTSRPARRRRRPRPGGPGTPELE